MALRVSLASGPIEVLLIELDGKALLREHGVAVPAGTMVRDATIAALTSDGPWMVKVQVPVGGRGRVGGVARCTTPADVRAAVQRMLGSRLKGHTVTACLIEQAVAGEERYLAVMVDAAGYGLRVIYSLQGGVDIEHSELVEARLCPPDPAAVAEALAALSVGEPEAWRRGVVDVGRKLAGLVIERELALAEINPLFVSSSGCFAGDAKLVVDLAAVDRQPQIGALIAARAQIYVDAHRRLTEGFDYVELDPDGEIGLITTGAGLSMMLIDEVTARGLKPLNFCDIRTGQMRGSPARVMRVLEWITARRSVRAVLVSVFGGITDLAEFAELLASAIEQTPNLCVPMVARLIGRNASEARRILAQRQPGVVVTEDLEEALQEIAGTIGVSSGARPAAASDEPSLSLPAPHTSRVPVGLAVLSSLSSATPVIVQGITGRMGRTHAALMRAYGTNIVGGTSARSDASEAAGVPVFADCYAAVRASGAVVSVAMTPPLETLIAVEEALAAGIRLIVTVAEGIPVHDAMKIGCAVRRAGATWIGGSTPGMAIPGKIKLGFLPDVCLRPGPFAIMSKSGTLSYECGYRLVRAGLGQSIWVGVGGDQVKGVRFADLLPLFFADSATRGVILIGEVGGSEEEECADALERLGLCKPVYALIAGREAREGVAMGHAGALVLGEAGSIASKTRRLAAAGVQVFGSIATLIEACVRDYAETRPAPGQCRGGPLGPSI
jgi:succinyl-CoA synthetase alpha subunit/succinyl-CoA synthetase beta subunit